MPLRDARTLGSTPPHDGSEVAVTSVCRWNAHRKSHQGLLHYCTLRKATDLVSDGSEDLLLTSLLD